MAFYDQVWYANAGNQSSTGYYAVTVRPQNTAVAAGVLRRQFTAPAVGSERVFVCVVAGTTANTTDATWTLTRGAKTTDNTVTWQECTGASAVNGDLTNTVNWTVAKATGTPTLGAIIQRNSGASYQICSTAGTMGASEPAFSNTAGVTTNDGTSVWTSLGVVGNFTGGQAPFARLAAACASTWFAAGNTLYVGDNHAESQATIINLQPAGSVATVGRILCHNHSGSYPPAAGDLMTGAVIATTGSVNNVFTPQSGGFYLYGLSFRVAVGQSTSQNYTITSGGVPLYYDNCSIDIATTGGASAISITGGGTITFNNTTVKFAAVGQLISVNSSQLFWQNTGQVLVSGSTVPTNLMALIGFAAVLEAIDLSQITSNLFNAAVSNVIGNIVVKDCKLNAAMTIATPQISGLTVQIVRSDSSGTAYKSARYAYEGIETTETSITRVGGSVDPTGQAQSRKIVTTANTQWLRPFKAEPYVIWNPTTIANVVVTVYGTINSASLPNNDDIFIDVEYLGSSATPLGTTVTTTKSSVLAANAAVTSDSSTWNGGGSGAGWSPFKLTKTLSLPQPGLAGYIEARVRVGKLSATYYIDPMPVLT